MVAIMHLETGHSPSSAFNGNGDNNRKKQQQQQQGPAAMIPHAGSPVTSRVDGGGAFDTKMPVSSSER